MDCLGFVQELKEDNAQSECFSRLAMESSLTILFIFHNAFALLKVCWKVIIQ
jgi:hypothetical protein